MMPFKRPRIRNSSLHDGSAAGIFAVCLLFLNLYDSESFMYRPQIVGKFRRDSGVYCDTPKQSTSDTMCWQLQRLQVVHRTSTTLHEAVDQDVEAPAKSNIDLSAFDDNSDSDTDFESNKKSRDSNIKLASLDFNNIDTPMPTENGGFSHTTASRAKIGAANKGKTPWNKGRQRSAEEKAKIAAGVRARNRERFLKKLEDLGLTEEEYEEKKKADRRIKDAERRARRTAAGGYRPTEETKAKISKILKEKHARGEIKRKAVDPSKVRRGFTHSEETRQKISESLKKRWSKDTEYREHMTSKMKNAYSKEDVRKKVSESLKKKWQDPQFRAEMMAKMNKNRKPPNMTEEYRSKISEAMKKKWQDPEYREKTLNGIANHRATTDSKPRKARPARTPRPRKAATPRGSSSKTEVHLMQPLSSGKHKKKVAKSKRKSKKPSKSEEGKVSAVTPQKAPTKKKKAAAKKDKTKVKKVKEPDGSVNRLREERRDLFDLLYGDDAFDDKGNESDDGDSTDPESRDDEMMDRLTDRFDLGDEDLDSFDPYGLDDY